MDRSFLPQHFLQAAVAARDFAREYLAEELPDEMVFRVHLNSSHDAHAGPEFKLFPEDSSDERLLATKQLDDAAVVQLLWRDGSVPQWVDLMVAGVTGQATVLDLVVCGRYIDDETRLYYAETGIAPFSPKGPFLPVNHVDGVRFSIYERSSCWSLEDLERVQGNAAEVWSLGLHGPAFDDESLSAVKFPRLEILELLGARLVGPGFQGLKGLPRLRHLRASFGSASRLELTSLPTMRTLESLAMRCLPPTLVCVARIANALPGLKELTLGATDPVRADGDMALPPIERLTLEFPTIPPWISLPPTLRWLSVHSPKATDDDLGALLSGCSEQLDSLGLRGTPVSDALLSELERFPRLKYLDAVGTRITEERLRHFVEARPGFKSWPNVRA